MQGHEGNSKGKGACTWDKAKCFLQAREGQGVLCGMPMCVGVCKGTGRGTIVWGRQRSCGVMYGEQGQGEGNGNTEGGRKGTSRQEGNARSPPPNNTTRQNTRHGNNKVGRGFMVEWGQWGQKGKGEGGRRSNGEGTQQRWAMHKGEGHQASPCPSPAPCQRAQVCLQSRRTKLNKAMLGKQEHRRCGWGPTKVMGEAHNTREQVGIWQWGINKGQRG